MPYDDKRKEQDDFWDIEKLLPRKRSSLSPFATKPMTADITIEPKEPASPNESKERTRLTVLGEKKRETEDTTYTPSGGLIKSITVKKYKESYDFYDNFRKSAILYFDCPGSRCDFAQFFSYMSQYSQLTRSQKDYYFYWRSEMRHGRFIKTDYSYLYLYVYEIINLPDLIPPEEGIKLLCRLWKEYRAALPRIDLYFSIWVRDYCLVHKLPPPTALICDMIFDVIRNADIKEYYFTDIDKDGSDAVWALIAYLSDYDWHKGLVSVIGQCTRDGQSDGEEKRKLYTSVFEGAIRCLTPLIWEHCLLSRSNENLTRVQCSAFPNSLCTHTVKCKLEIEYYRISDSRELRAAVTGAVRYTENRIRALFGVKSRISVRQFPDEYRSRIDAYFGDVNAKKEREIARANAPEYEKYYNAPSTPLSSEGADEIERLSWDITARLCPEEDSIEAAPLVIAIEAEADAYKTDIHKAQGEDMPSEEDSSYGLSPDDIALLARLADTDGISVSMDGESAIERINEAFADNFGDVIIENAGDGFAVIDDYKEDVKEWLRNLQR